MLWLSLRVASVSTAVSTVLGLCLAWLLVNRQFPGRRELGALATAALILPAPILCYYFLFHRPGLNSWGITAAAMLSAVPVPVRVARNALASVDPAYGKAARSLGASDWRIFWRIELPLVHRAAIGAAALAFARVLAELAATFLIAARLSP